MKVKIIKTGLIIIVGLLVLSLGRKVYEDKKTRLQKQTVFIAGLDKNQTGIVKELDSAMTEFNYVKIGNQYLDNGEYVKAVEQFETVIERNRSAASVINARTGLINVYEKMKDYAKAKNILQTETDKYMLPKTAVTRIPDEKRLKYLEYASEGNYDLAIAYAQKAVDASANLPGLNGKPRQDYMERLNDLKVSKEYIESLKTN